MIHYFQNFFSILNLNGFLIFDGSHKTDEQSGKVYRSPLEITYTPKGQTADCYILEMISHQKNKKSITLVTNDSGLKRQARSYGVKVLSCEDFIVFLENKKKPINSVKEIKDSSYQIERLLKIFEKKLQKNDEDYFF